MAVVVADRTPLRIFVQRRHMTDPGRKLLSADWKGELPWPTVPAVGETIFCCTKILGTVARREFTLEDGEIGLTVLYGYRDAYEQAEHLVSEHGFNLASAWDRPDEEN